MSVAIKSFLLIDLQELIKQTDTKIHIRLRKYIYLKQIDNIFAKSFFTSMGLLLHLHLLHTKKWV